MMLIAAVIALISLGAADAAERRQFCFSCRSSTASSPCHEQPPRTPEYTIRCTERPINCVTERLQTEDGMFVSIERRCSTQDETKVAQNKCVKTENGLQRCLTICFGSFCNSRTGELFQHPEDPWDYDDPEYSDNIYDPHEAVLSPRKQRPHSGPLPAGTAQLPAGTAQLPAERNATQLPAERKATQLPAERKAAQLSAAERKAMQLQEREWDESRTISRSGPAAERAGERAGQQQSEGGRRYAADRGAGVMVKGEVLLMLMAAMLVMWWR